MTYQEFLQKIHNLNDAEIFYKGYFEAKKSPQEFNKFLENLDINYLLKNHYIIPEIKETMPPSMKDEYLLSPNDNGMLIQKHNCYSPVFNHYHSYFECIYVYEGICIHEFRGVKQLFKTGDFCIIPPETVHSISVQDQSIIFNLIISTETLNNTFNNKIYYKDNVLSRFFINNFNFKSTSSILIFHTGNDNDIKQLIIQMALESINRFPESDAVLNGGFSILFAYLLRYYADNAQTLGINANKTDLINKMIMYIEENYNVVSLQSLALEFNYSKEYISKIIKDNTGKSFSDILFEIKMKHALILIETTNLTINEIANHIGYENPENLIRAFKKQYHTTPTNYRKSFNKDIIE